MTKGYRRLCATALLVLACLPVSWPVSAEGQPDWAALESAAQAAPDDPTLEQLTTELRTSLPAQDAQASTKDLSDAARVYAALVARAQAIDATAAVFATFVDLAGPLEDRVTARRERLEEEAGEDEARLESLYRSDRWQRLGATRVEVSYWRGWAQLARVQRGLSGDDRAEALADAERAFGRAARALAFPDRALRGLLGLGIARRERGDLQGARQSFERVQAQRAIQSDPELAAVVRYELALTAIEARDMAQAQKWVDALEKEGTMSSEQQRSLEARWIAALLTKAHQGDSPGSREASSEAARRLRALFARGGAGAELAGRLVARFADTLAGEDLGPVGALLEADRAFLAEDYQRALAFYDTAFQGDLPDDVDLGQAGLRAAFCKLQTGQSDDALADLEALLATELTNPQRVDATRLLQSLAEARLASSPGAESPADLARANRVARLLLEVAPDGVGADIARLRRGRDLAHQGRLDAGLAELAAIPKESTAYPAALVERVRLEAQWLDAKGRAVSAVPGQTAPRVDPGLHAMANRLAQSIDEVRMLRDRDELPPDAQQAARLAVLRARAAWLRGEDPVSVEAWLVAAREQPGLDAAGRRAILSVELALLVGGNRIDELVALLAERDDERLRAEFNVWNERIADLDGSSSATAALPDLYARLEKAAPEPSRTGMALRRVAALRRAGRNEDAVALATRLAQADPESGDAWLELARSLDAARDYSASPAAWRRVGSGASPGSELWWEAHLSLHDAALARGEPKRACGWIDATEDIAEPSALEGRITKARAVCRASDGAGEP